MRRRRRAVDRLTVRIDPDVRRQLDLLSAKGGTNPSALAREIIETGVMNASERAWAPLTRAAVREELDAFLTSERIAREFAVDDLYGALANELRLDLDDLRILAGAALSMLSDAESNGSIEAHLREGARIGFEEVRRAIISDESVEDGYL